MQARTATDVEELHRLHSRSVFRYAYRRVLDIECARQITNDAFRLAWQRAVAPGPDALPWLLVTARNLLSNEIRSRGRERKLALKLAAQQLTERRSDASGLSGNVQAVLGLLRDKDREVLMLAYWDGLPVAEIATVLGCSVESAKSRLFRARKAFKRESPKMMLNGGGN